MKNFACIGDLLDVHARAAPAAPAILAPQRPPLTYAELSARTQNAVRSLRALGIAPTDRVGVALPRGADSALALIAVATASACVPINPDLTADELFRYFSELKLTALVTGGDANSASRSVARSLGIAIVDFVTGPDESLGAYELAGPAIGPAIASGASRGEDDAFILLTSGTAARPKMVPLTHASVCLSASNAGHVLSLVPGDRLLNVLPLFHAHGLISGLLTALAAGSSVICTGGFDAASFFAWMKELQPTWYTAVPTIHRALLSAAEQHPERARPSSLRLIRSASASLAPAILDGLETRFGVPVIETYGMTEAASQIAANPLQRRKIGSVGRPAGPEIAIMDSAGERLADGEHGEIMLRGPTMTRGYHNDDDSTKASFRDGWFRTGDLGYLDADGYLFIVGRIKDVINRGGQKISPLEVEEVLLSHPAVLEAGAFAVPHNKLGENVAAVVVLRPGTGVSSDQLRQFARKRLAAYKVPSLIAAVPALPKGASGKIRRNALAELISAAGEKDDEKRLPRSALESQLAELWAQLLELPQVGRDQDIFALGADSLAVTQMRSRLRERFNVDFSFEDIFDTPTVALLAARLQTAANSRNCLLPVWRRAAADGADAPLSFQQQRMYLLSRLDPTRYNYNVVEVALLSGKLDIEALAASVAAVCKRHDVLRSTFTERQGEPLQKVQSMAPRLDRVKLKSCPADRRLAVVRREAARLAQVPFELEREPPLKVTLLTFDRCNHALVVNVHHLVTDGWSQRLFWQELAACYAATRNASAASLPAPAFCYRDFAIWQQSWSQTPAAKEQLDYWSTQLDGVTTLPLRTDRPRPKVWSGHGARHYLAFSKALSARLRSLSQDQGVTSFMTLLAAFQCLLFRHTGHEDVAIGSLIANRNQIESESMIGLFANTLILRTDFAGDPTFGALLRRVRQVTLDAYRNQDLPIEEVLRALQVSRSRDANPLFQVMFILQNASIEAARFPGLSTRRLEVDPQVARFDITLELVEADGHFSGFFEYATDLFDAATIARIAAQFKTLIKAVTTADPEQPVSRLPILSAAERRHLLAEGSGAAADFSRRGNFAERFDRQVKQRPNAVAVSNGSVSLSYRELARRSQSIARWLVREGMGAETIVALLADRGPDLLAAMIAVRRIGAAFLNLDSDQPPARLATILGSSCARMLLAASDKSGMLDELLAPPVERIRAAKLEDLIELGSTGPARPARPAPSGLAYLVYTSGSSGVPKGVMVEQRGLSNHLASLISELGLSARDVIAQTAPQSFVISVWQFLAGPMIGARVHICTNAIVQDPVLLAGEIERERITVLEIVPSLLRAILERVNEEPILRAFSSLRLLISTGEPLSVDLCRTWFAHYPDVPLINAYGASECSDDVSLHRLTRAAATTAIVPVGAPLPNTQLYVLDPHLQPQPIGVVGELYVGGAGVGRGYINDPAQTRQRFLSDPLSRQVGKRLYRTGDLARRLADGTIACLGRIDHQAKVRGYRIELKEIEHALNQHPSVRAGIVETRRDADGDIRLVAHIAAKAGSRISASELREVLKARLPAHAIPSAFLFLEQVPLNAHGKIDRSALLTSTQLEMAASETTVPARRFTEKVLSDIWMDLLKVERLGVADNFFDLGGHSLLAGRTMARVARALGVSLPIKTIFEAPTVEQLARRVDEALATRSQGTSPIIPHLAESGPLPPSIAQAQMIRIERDLPDLPLFNLPFALRLQGPLDVRALGQTLDEVIGRHQSLRTAFGWNGDEPTVLVVNPGEIGPLLTIEAVGSGKRTGDKRLKALQLRKIELLAEQDALAPIDTTRAPLLRARLLRLQDDDHVLLLTIHHAIADGWSIGVLFEEISRQYSALVGRPSEPVPTPPLAFSDVARWQRWWCGTEAAQRQTDDWAETLRGAVPVFGGSGEATKAAPGLSTGHHPVRLDSKLIARLNAFSHSQNGTLFINLLTGLKALLLARTGRTDLCVATAMANRTQPDTERVVGPFENTVIVRTRIEPELSFAQAFARVRQSVLEAHARQEIPSDILAARLQDEGIDPASLSQVYFTMQNPLRQPLELPDIAVRSFGNIAREGQPVLPIDQTWLSLMLKERPSGINGSCNYKRGLLGSRAIGEWMKDFISILANAAARPNVPLGRLLDRKAA